MEIVEDTCGNHDTLGGHCSAESNSVRFGLDKKYMHSCRDNYLTIAAQLEMSPKDITNNINFFMNVPVEENGHLAIVDGISKPGDYVEMVAHMDTLVLISNCPQLNNPCNGYNPTPLPMAHEGTLPAWAGHEKPQCGNLLEVRISELATYKSKPNSPETNLSEPHTLGH